MERLTAFDGEFWVHKNFPPVGEDTVDEFVDCVKELAERLAAYEDFMERWRLGNIEDAERIFRRVNDLGGTDLMAQYRGLGPIDRLRELARADREGRCIIPPVKIGETVYHIKTCKDFPQVYDWTLYGAEGGPGTATGLYCPCELAEICPFPCDDGSFDCDEHKNTPAIFEDVVTAIYIDNVQNGVTFEYSGGADFEDFGKTVFLTREEAEAALKGEDHETDPV